MRKKRDGGKETGLEVVLDTNVYVSIFNYPGSLTAQVWHHALKRNYRLFISPMIVREFTHICRRDFHWDEKKIRDHVRLLNKVSKF